MNEELFLRFIANVLSIRTWKISTDDTSLTFFEKECCFEKTLQPMYTEDSIRYLMEHANEETFYEITDYLATNVLLFRFDKKFYLLGPYVMQSFQAEEMQKLLASHNLPASILLSLKLYYNQFPQLSFSMIRGVVLAAMRTFLPNTPEYSYRNLTGFHEEIQKKEVITESNRTYAQIMQQYEMENYFLRMITNGDVDAVRLAFESITQTYYSTTDATQRSLYSTDYSGFAVLRTLARKAAEAGGCPIVRIDEITQESIQRFASARNNAALDRIQKDMLLSLTQAVADAKSMAVYSPVIRDILNYLNAKYSEDFTVAHLAKTHHISLEHLSRLFKKEVGETITAYITRLRTEKAAELLKGSDLAIADIAMYVGYSDSNYFVKVFKKRYGMTPSAYRSSI